MVSFEWMRILPWVALLSFGCHEGLPFGQEQWDDREVEGAGQGGAPSGGGGLVPPTTMSPDPIARSGGETGAGGSEPVGESGGTGGLSYLQDVGRLPNDPIFCWVKLQGGDDAIWEEKRVELQETISRWQGASALTIRWIERCSDVANVADVRILLDDRGEVPAQITGCDQPDRKGPWGVYPNERGQYRGCDWNMSLPLDLPSPEYALHAVGHALGYSHEHLRLTDTPLPCPDELETAATNPYLAEYDPLSVMHYGQDEEAAFLGHPWQLCQFTVDGGYGGLSSGDLLAVEMLYPRSVQRGLGSSGWIAFQGLPTFRSNGPIHLVSDWASRGASEGWLTSPYWTIYSPIAQEPLISSGLSTVVDVGSVDSLRVGHVFTDFFGAHHYIAREVQVSNAGHTAVVMNLL